MRAQKPHLCFASVGTPFPPASTTAGCAAASPRINREAHEACYLKRRHELTAAPVQRKRSLNTPGAGS